MEKRIAAIELGSKKAKLVIGYELNGKPCVVYTLTKPYGEKLLEGGNILNAQKLIDTVKELTSVVDPSVKLKINVSDIVLSLPPYGLEVLNTKQTTGTSDSETKVTSFDIKNLYSIIRNLITSNENSLVDIVPHSFVLDGGRSFVRAPIGDTSSTIQVIANVHILPSHIVKDYKNIFERANVSVKRCIVSPLAALEMINTDPTMPKSYFLVDVGSNSTTVSLVGVKSLYSSTYFDWGGDNITQRIIEEFQINESDAEKYKITYGIDKRIMNFNAPVCTTTKEDGTTEKHSVDELNDIIKVELDSFAKQINTAIDTLLTNLKPSYRNLPMVLVGGGSKLFGLVDYIKPKVPAEEIHLFEPKILGARNATYTNCLGMILVCSKYPTILDEHTPKIGVIQRETNSLVK